MRDRRYRAFALAALGAAGSYAAFVERDCPTSNDTCGAIYGSTTVAGSVKAWGVALASSPDGTQLLVAVTRAVDGSADGAAIQLFRYSVCPASAP